MLDDDPLEYIIASTLWGSTNLLLRSSKRLAIITKKVKRGEMFEQRILRVVKIKYFRLWIHYLQPRKRSNSWIRQNRGEDYDNRSIFST